MNEHFSDFHEDAVERRHQDHLDSLPNRGEMKPYSGWHCLMCGHGIEMSKHYGKVYHFDRGTDTLHVCKPTYKAMRAMR